MTLTWSNVTGEDGYKIERSTDGTTWKWVGTTLADVTAWTDTQLSLSTSYYYRVHGYNDGGVGAYSSSVNPTTLDSAHPMVMTASALGSLPIMPTSSVATMLATSKVKVSWTAMAGTTSYQIQRSTNGVSWATIKTLGSKLRSYLDQNLKAGKYYYRVTALDRSGNVLGNPIAVLSV